MEKDTEESKTPLSRHYFYRKATQPDQPFNTVFLKGLDNSGDFEDRVSKFINKQSLRSSVSQVQKEAAHDLSRRRAERKARKEREEIASGNLYGSSEKTAEAKSSEPASRKDKQLFQKSIILSAAEKNAWLANIHDDAMLMNPHQWLKLANLFNVNSKAVRQQTFLDFSSSEDVLKDRSIEKDDLKPLENYMELRDVQNRNYARDAVAEGIKLTKQNRIKEAMEFYKRSLDMDPKYPEGWFHLAESLVQQRKLTEAAEQLERVLKLDPTHEGATALLASIQRTVQPKKQESEWDLVDEHGESIEKKAEEPKQQQTRREQSEDEEESRKKKKKRRSRSRERHRRSRSPSDRKKRRRDESAQSTRRSRRHQRDDSVDYRNEGSSHKRDDYRRRDDSPKRDMPRKSDDSRRKESSHKRDDSRKKEASRKRDDSRSSRHRNDSRSRNRHDDKPKRDRRSRSPVERTRREHRSRSPIEKRRRRHSSSPRRRDYKRKRSLSPRKHNDHSSEKNKTPVDEAKRQSSGTTDRRCSSSSKEVHSMDTSKNDEKQIDREKEQTANNEKQAITKAKDEQSIDQSKATEHNLESTSGNKDSRETTSLQDSKKKEHVEHGNDKIEINKQEQRSKPLKDDRSDHRESRQSCVHESRRQLLQAGNEKKKPSTAVKHDDEIKQHKERPEPSVEKKSTLKGSTVENKQTDIQKDDQNKNESKQQTHTTQDTDKALDLKADSNTPKDVMSFVNQSKRSSMSVKGNDEKKTSTHAREPNKRLSVDKKDEIRRYIRGERHVTKEHFEDEQRFEGDLPTSSRRTFASRDDDKIKDIVKKLVLPRNHSRR